MYSSLYQTFYPYNKFDDIQSITQLNKWMLSKETMAKLCFNNIVLNNDTTEIVTPKNCDIKKEKNKMQLIIPEKSDTLFWCIYISHYGERDYLAIGNKYGNAEIAEKQKIMEFLKSNKNALKYINRKITQGTFQEIMSDLMTNAKTLLQILPAFSVYYKKHILLLNENNRTYLEYRYDERSVYNTNVANDELRELGPWIVIKYTENKKYGVYAEMVDNIYELISEYIYIAAPDKPLRGISTYKIGELVEIATKIPELAKEPKMQKPELYGKIWHCLLWL